MKKSVMLLAFAVLAAGGAFAQRVGDTASVFGSNWTVQSVSGDTVTLKKAGGIPTFTSIPEFQTWLNSQSANNASSPYNVKLNVSGLGSNAASLGNVLRANANKYVNLDLSGSTFTSLGTDAFSGRANLTGVTLPNSVTSIDMRAFMGCSSLTSLTIPNRVTSIGSNAFDGCTSLTSITIPNSVTSIGNAAFVNITNLTSVTFQGTIPSSGFVALVFHGDLRAKFYASNSTNGTAGTYTTTAPVNNRSVWTKQ
jgi:hypothetical protein